MLGRQIVTRAIPRTAGREMSHLSDRVKNPEVQKNVWVEFVGLAMENQALNVGQGFPNFPPIQHVMDGLSNIPVENHLNNQYTRGFGHAPFVQALGDFYGPLFDRKLDVNNEILVTVGAYFSLYAATQALINPGDEAIIIEPFFDCYAPMVKYAGGTPKFIPLKPAGNADDANDWKLDMDHLQSLVTDKTKLIFFNNPNNPLGKVFTHEEVQALSEFCIKNDLICLADEVYEHLAYNPQPHLRIGNYPGMYERTITMGSAGKTWSCTGWKIGWSIGPADLIKAMQIVWQNSIYTCATPLQEACARSFRLEMERPFDGHAKDNPESYFRTLTEVELRPKREKMAKILESVGMKPIIPNGGYFMIADASPMKKIIPEEELDDSDDPWDYKAVRWMCRQKKIAAIPNSAFYSDGHKRQYENYIRFCFAKDDATLDKFEEMMVAGFKQ